MSEHIHQQKVLPLIALFFKEAYVVYPVEKVVLIDKKTFAEHDFIGVSIADLRRLPFSRLLTLKTNWWCSSRLRFAINVI